MITRSCQCISYNIKYVHNIHVQRTLDYLTSSLLVSCAIELSLQKTDALYDEPTRSTLALQSVPLNILFYIVWPWRTVY